MLQTHPFLFRVHDDRSYVKPTNDNDFIAREFVGTSANYVRERVLRDELPLNFQSYTVQQSVLAHICNWHRRQKPRLGRRFPWISGTPLWSWAIGEAIERNRMRDDDPDRANIIMLSVIDLRKLLVYEDSIQRRMVYYGMELLHLTASNQPDDFKKASNWTNPSQEIMVYGMIPASAVINTIVFADPFSTMTISPGTSLPLPPWFFEFFAVSNDSNRMIWPKCRWDDWYCGGHRTKECEKCFCCISRTGQGRGYISMSEGIGPLEKPGRS
ncbi:hypothetical protein D9757_009307 [Collybiopsis confluens]|uniref:DUF7587 domain-containing protein n=1 Tax=Collybiopsis confluens TaxID=2823264 RepID=A0A8H5H3M8_9AGAR|nr:hypothetical protein D9757_009307 [Collybiopsis confluens]